MYEQMQVRNLCYMMERREKLKRQYVSNVVGTYDMLHEGICANDKQLAKWSQRELTKLASDLGPHSQLDDYYASFAHDAVLEQIGEAALF